MISPRGARVPEVTDYLTVLANVLGNGICILVRKIFDTFSSFPSLLSLPLHTYIAHHTRTTITTTQKLEFSTQTYSTRTHHQEETPPNRASKQTTPTRANPRPRNHAQTYVSNPHLHPPNPPSPSSQLTRSQSSKSSPPTPPPKPTPPKPHPQPTPKRNSNPNQHHNTRPCPRPAPRNP